MATENTSDSIYEEGGSLPVYKRVQVTVVGGGPSGIAAAISAARNGADVLLIERNACPGGTGPMAFVNEFHSTENLSGVGAEIVARLGEIDGAARNVEPEYFAIAYDPEKFRLVVLEMLEEAGVQMLFYTWTVKPILEKDTVKGVVIENKSGRQAVLADVVIDASGDADLAARAGVEMQPYVEPQPMSMLFRMGGIDFKRIQEYAREHPEDFSRRGRDGVPPNALDGNKFIHIGGWKTLIQKAKENGEIPRDMGNSITVFGITPTYLENSIGVLYGGVHVTHKDPFNADDLTTAEIEARRKVRALLPFLNTLPGLEKAYLIDVAPNIGVRDSRRILGDYTLTREDIFAHRSFDDQIAVCVHRGPTIKGWRMHPPDASEGSKAHVSTLQAPTVVLVFGIPYRSLLPKGFERLLVVGKTISMDYETHARCRDQVECMAFGQAAGVAAALAAREGVTPREIDVQEVRTRLSDQGLNIRQEAVNIEKIKSILRSFGREVPDRGSYPIPYDEEEAEGSTA